MPYNPRRTLRAIDIMFYCADQIPVPVQLEFASQVSFATELAHNRFLSRAAWDQLMAKKQDAKTAEALAARPLSRDQRLRILKTESRQGVLEALVYHNPPQTLTELNDLITLIKRRDVLGKVYDVVRTSPRLADTLGPHLVAKRALEWLADTKRPDPNLVVAATLQSLAARSESWYTRIILIKIFDIHPDLISPVLAQLTHPAVLEAAATSINVTEDQQAFLLGLDPADLRDPQALAQNQTTSVATPSSVFSALARNPVTTPRILLAMEKDPDASQSTRRDVKKRNKLNPTLLRARGNRRGLVV